MTPNLRLETVVQFLPDPRGWGMFAALAGRLRRDLLVRPVLDARSENYGGWAATPQRFTGLAGLAAGRQRVLASRTSQLVNERSNMNQTAMSAFYERLQREQG